MQTLLGGRYRLGTAIAAGGMSAVHRAWDVVMRRAVAVKVYLPDEDGGAPPRLPDEARILAALSHPGLVAVYDAGTDEGHPYLVLQLIEGPTLRERLASGPLSLHEVCDIGARLAETLAYVHANGVIHQDVKPSNVLLDADGTPYLADFGISVPVHGTRPSPGGRFFGTAGYLAPEQVLGRRSRPAVDVYALGLVLLECLTGRAEYTGTDVEAAVARLSRAPHIPEGIPPDLADLIAAMTAREPAHRPRAADCAALLRATATSAPAPAAPMPAPLPTPPATPLPTSPPKPLPTPRPPQATAPVPLPRPAPVPVPVRPPVRRPARGRSVRPAGRALGAGSRHRPSERMAFGTAAGVTAAAAAIGVLLLGSARPAGTTRIDSATPIVVAIVPDRHTDQPSDQPSAQPPAAPQSADQPAANSGPVNTVEPVAWRQPARAVQSDGGNSGQNAHGSGASHGKKGKKSGRG